MSTSGEQLLLAHSASKLAAGSHIVEVGSWLMGTARILAEANPNASVLCVDPFSGPVVERQSLEYLKDYPEFQGLRSPELARAIVRDLDNITIMPAVSPYYLAAHPDRFDLYFEDGNHKDPMLKANLDYWLPLLKPMGILALHDSNMPDVVQHIQRLLAKGYTIRSTCDSLTILVKPPSGSEADAEI